MLPLISIENSTNHILLKDLGSRQYCHSCWTVTNLRDAFHLGMSAKAYEAPEIRQIDKLARYLFLCKDLIRITRKEEYAAILRDINVTYLRAFCEISRASH